MMTVITETTVKPGQQSQWDQAYEVRMREAEKQPGWVDAQLLIPEGDTDKRIVIGTWESREHWERWHNDEAFQQTKQALDSATESEGQPRWYQVRTQSPAPA